jgi:GNAT superfamily N-acetyltransferase
MEPKVRPARPSDKAPLMSFIKDVWGGHDYIPRVWDEWLTDRRGKMFVVEVDGVPVGMNRVRFLEDGSAWFEGARVHPDFRGRGLGSMLGENSMQVAKEMGVRVFRLTSGSHNRPAHRQIARIRFREATRFSVYEPKRGARVKPKGDAEKMGVGSHSMAMRMVRATREFALGKGVFWHDFTAAALTPEVVRGLLKEGAIWRNGKAVAVAREGGGGEGSVWEELCFLGGPAEDAMELVGALVGRNPKARERWVFVPHGSPLIHSLRLAGFVRNFSMILFERRIAKG